jgi:hypothetical protein
LRGAGNVGAAELSRDQIEQLSRDVRPMAAYLHRLQARMDAVGFAPGDRPYRSVRKAVDAMHTLFVELHYLASDAGRRAR